MTISGIPLHPLLVHLSVVGVPLVAVFLALIMLVPRWRERHDLTGLVLAAGAVLSTWLTRMTGEALLVAQGGTEEAPGRAADHVAWANQLTVVVILLFLVMALKVLVARVPALRQVLEKKPFIRRGLRAVVLGAALGVVVATVYTGHEGALLVWAGEN